MQILYMYVCTYVILRKYNNYNFAKTLLIKKDK